jgi:hypothetical protein
MINYKAEPRLLRPIIPSSIEKRKKCLNDILLSALIFVTSPILLCTLLVNKAREL